MSARTTVLLVDDHSVVREGYRRLLEVSGGITVVGEAASATEAYHMFCSLMPDVAVMDIALPGVSGIEALRRILVHEPKARVLMFSMYEDAIFARRALEAGAAGYLTKAAAPRVLVEAVASVAGGRRFLSPDVAQTLALQPLSTEQGSHEILSAREFEVLKLLADGCALNEIARQLGLNPKTVANHQSSIRQKLGADNGTQLLRAAIRLGLVPPF
ncbi:response regulator [Peristeroidobacter soli]|jgi:DNA-binding NarL/FixJ family response regulator|uniref:response regulator n=1 Tax=Peristeroidobacter soli TaxID=2497877 RepID=UPI00101DF8CF|nr:response regulator transcription factor [Peristeroidobacter soli]